MIENNYDHQLIEGKIYNFWEENNLFAPIVSKIKKRFSIVIPPPNVTGNLHMGHALNNSIQDLLIRYYRKKGYETLWQPGTDHAGIATELIVEKNINSQNKKKCELGREDFLKEVWKWKEQSGNSIVNQLKKLGSSCDWRNIRFTMDKGLSEAVIKVFLELYKKKLIYKDFKLTNWDPFLKTAISDLEVVQKEVVGKLYYIKYFITENNYITIATTRPETIFADTAIAVNPKDKRFKKIIGKYAIIPIIGKKIKIISDDYADPNQGSGAVKITPAHDFNDYEVGLRHKLELINILDPDGKLNNKCPNKYVGIDRLTARDLIVNDLSSLGVLEKIDDIKHTVPFGDRSNSVIEPYLTEQWFLNVKKLSLKAISAVKKKQTTFYPENWTKIYYKWLKEIKPWCISRQIWWGHQIPIWYGKDGKIFAAKDVNEAQFLADKFYKKKNSIIKQDNNVLDTWFSSALWPFASLGWPDNYIKLKKFYPTSVLVTGFDILFFWVARMMMMSLFVMKKVPFHKVYIHALVRDEQGQKMSKSKGNIIDPLILINKYGADALRFTLLSMTSPGRDVKLSEDRIKGYRNFLTKIWNVAKFTEINQCNENIKNNFKELTIEINQWIINEFISMKKETEILIQNFRFDEASRKIYHYVWNVFCDWYLEFTKPIFQSKDLEKINETKQVFGFVFSQILSSLHPFIPFITEDLWSKLKYNDYYKSSLIQYNSNHKIFTKKNKSINNLNWMIELITFIRSIKNTFLLSPGVFVDINISQLSKDKNKFLLNNSDIFKRLARIENFFETSEDKINILPLYVNGETIYLKFNSEISLNEHLIKLKTKISIINNTINIIKNKLKNKSFILKAPKDIIEKEKQNLNSALNDLKHLESIVSIKT
jgi:valyl-tRNA synthetase